VPIDPDDPIIWRTMPEYLSDAQLGLLLDVKPAQVRSLVPEGLPSHRIGRATYHPTVPALKWLLQQPTSWRDRWR
jgi:hypothetical protein